jgi:hypothetical protein
MEAPQPKPSRLKKFIRRLLFTLAALVTFVALLVAEEEWRSAHAWNSYKREMEAKGEHFDAARLIPPKVPDDQNFGMTPYFALYFNLPPEILRQPIVTTTKMVNGRLVEETTGNVERGTNLRPVWYDREVKRAPRPLGWNCGMAADLTGWAAAIQGTNADGTAAQITDPAEAASIILDNMKSCEATLAELESASQRPYCRFNIPYEEIANPQVLEALVQHLAAIKGVYQVLSLHAEAEMARGRSEQALKDIEVMFRVDDGLKEEPAIISQLVRYAGAAILLQPVGEGLAEHRWSEAQLGVLQERLQRTDLIASTVLGLYGERDIWSNQMFDRGEVLSGVFPGLFPWGRLEQLNINRMFQATVLPRIDVAAREINPSVSQACDARFQVSEGSGLHAFFQHSIMAKMMLPAFSRVAQKTAFAQSEVDMAMISCALERYRLAEGRYPDALNDLVPRFAARLPHDIINGQPMKYRRTEDGRFVLYSVGWNEKDDGGIVAATKTKPPRQDVLQGDWVWEYPGKN